MATKPNFQLEKRLYSKQDKKPNPDWKWPRILQLRPKLTNSYVQEEW
jgi:hypothetical protein